METIKMIAHVEGIKALDKTADVTKCACDSAVRVKKQGAFT